MAGQARSTSSFVDAGTHRRNVKAARLKVNRWAIEYFVPATRPRLETFGTMKEKLQRISNMLLSLCAGFASFAFTLVAVLMMRDLDEQIAASLTMGRSEEHTSELQSLMRISYAVFCLKKKKTTIKER